MKTKPSLLLPGGIPLLGFAGCYLAPLGMTVYYAFVHSTFDQSFSGAENFRYVAQNTYFRLGLQNLLGLGGCMVGAALLVAFLLAPLLCRHKKMALPGMAILLLPLLIPSISAVSLWEQVFDTNSLLSPLSSQCALITLYLWKYAGVAAVLLYTGLNKIPQDVLDAAALDGAGKIRTYVSVRLPMAGGYVGGMVMFLVMFLLRSYKECYLLFGDYPSQKLYMVQHYMNHQYMKMNFQYVAASAVILMALALLAYSLCFVLMKRRRGDVV